MMIQLNPGDRVRRINMPWDLMKVGDIGTVRSVSKHGANVWLKEYPGITFSTSNLEKIMKSLDTPETLEHGDVLVNEDFDYRRRIVQGVIGQAIITIDDESSQTALVLSPTELKDNGWQLEEDTTEVSVEQIAEKFNVPVDKLRIKD